MITSDFEYDGQLLSSLGFMICQFDESGGFNTSSAGSDLTITTVAQNGGKRHALVDARYKTNFETTFSICKIDGSAVSTGEYEYIMRWLNRQTFNELVIFPMDTEAVHFNGTFNVDKVEFRGSIVGFTLDFISDSVFGWGDEIIAGFTISSANDTYTIVDESAEIGYLYPDQIKITLSSAGTLIITNSIEPQRETIIKNCIAGEVITIYGRTLYIDTSASRNIYDSFNFVYPRLANSITESKNKLTFSLPCAVSIAYTPSKKVVF